MLAKNGERLIADALAALDWCDEVLVLDTGSTDDTCRIAASFANVRLVRLEGPFPGFGPAHGRAAALARNDWILSVDCDEIVSGELAEEISSLDLDPGCVYAMPFDNYFNRRLIRSCGWHPESHERLFNRRATGFCGSKVHERILSDGLATVRLRNPIRHYSYDSLRDFLRKMNDYSTLFAEQNAGGRRSGPGKAVARSAWAFLKSFILQKGMFQGYEGLVISAYKAQTVFWKYLLLHEANTRGGA
jgi:glycosyltransferase involved in cell wall biosynthesis